MNFPRVAVIGWWAAASMLLACSSDDTIVALNVSSNENVGPVSSLQITITQNGDEFTTDFEPPSQEVDGGGTRIAPQFFRRIRVPDSWERAPADVEVDAVDANGTAFLSASTRVTIRPEGAVAAYVMLAGAAPPSEGGEGGMGAGGESSGGAPSEAGAGGAAGSGSGGVPAEGGAGGVTDAGAGGI